MKILLNLYPLARAGAGISVYTHRLLMELVHSRDLDEVAGFLGTTVLSGNELRLWLSGLDNQKEKRVKEGMKSSPLMIEVLRRAARSIPGMYEFRYQLRNITSQFALNKFAQAGFIYHEPNYIPTRYSGKQVIAVHDLSHIRYPDFHPAERVAFLNRHLKRAIDLADFVLTDSVFVRNEILDVFPVSGEKIVVTHLGVDEAFHPRSEIETQDTMRQFNLSYRGFVLSVGTLEPRKNLERLLNAYGALPEGVRRNYPLVLAGGGGWKDSDLQRQIQQMERRGEVIRTGYLPQSQLLDLYASAAVFAYSSIYEGFGLPVLEGFASGTPVLTSNVTSMPEVSEGAALEVNPLSVDEIRHGLFSLLDDSALRYRHTQLGLERVREFTWAKCAEQTMAVYKQLG